MKREASRFAQKGTAFSVIPVRQFEVESKMKIAIVLAVCCAAAQAYPPPPGVVYRRDRPDFDCDAVCRRYGYDLKCSTDGNTYDNECYVECEWKYKQCDGPCPCMMGSRYISGQPSTYVPGTFQSLYDPVRPVSNNTPNAPVYQPPSAPVYQPSNPSSNVRPPPPPQATVYEPPKPNASINEPLRSISSVQSSVYSQPQTAPQNPSRARYCYCSSDYDPVCTIDRVTMFSKCEAQCEGKVVFYDGVCM